MATIPFFQTGSPPLVNTADCRISSLPTHMLIFQVVIVIQAMYQMFLDLGIIHVIHRQKIHEGLPSKPQLSYNVVQIAW